MTNTIPPPRPLTRAPPSCSAAPARPADASSSGCKPCDVPVRIGSRSAQPPFDWDDESTWAPALRGRRRGLHLVLPRSRCARRDRCHPLARQRRGRGRGGAPRPAVRSRRGRGPGLRAVDPGRRRRLDDPAGQLVQPELQRELSPGRGDERRSRRCPPATFPSRSSTPTTSPTSRWPHSRRTATPGSCTSSPDLGC